MLLTTLNELLMALADARHLPDRQAWAAQQLRHCQVSCRDGALSLLSSPACPQGVLDGEFLCPDFLICRELEGPSGRELRLEAASAPDPLLLAPLPGQTGLWVLHLLRDIHLTRSPDGSLRHDLTRLCPNGRPVWVRPWELPA